MVLRNLSVSDQKGEFLFSPEVRVDWRPFAYLENQVDVRSLTAQRMVLRRAPSLKPTTTKGPLLPNIDIDIGHLRIDRFSPSSAVSGSRRIARLDGRAHIATGRAQVWFDGVTLAGQGKAGGGDQLHLVLDAVPCEGPARLWAPPRSATERRDRGALGLRPPLAVRIDGRGDWRSWNGRFDG
jgi:translocation and assembly module TamB